MDTPPYLKSGDKVVLFDAVCKLCSGWSRFLGRHDRDRLVKLCSVQSVEGQAILDWFGFPTDHYETMVYVEDGRAYTKTDGIIRVLGQLPAPWPLLCVLRIVPRPVRDWIYDRIALNRYRLFGRYEQCMVPGPDLADRFLDRQ